MVPESNRRGHVFFFLFTNGCCVVGKGVDLRCPMRRGLIVANGVLSCLGVDLGPSKMRRQTKEPRVEMRTEIENSRGIANRRRPFGKTNKNGPGTGRECHV